MTTPYDDLTSHSGAQIGAQQTAPECSVCCGPCRRDTMTPALVSTHEALKLAKSALDNGTDAIGAAKDWRGIAKDWKARAERAERIAALWDELARGVWIDRDMIVDVPLDDDGNEPSIMEYLESAPWYVEAPRGLQHAYDELVNLSAPNSPATPASAQPATADPTRSAPISEITDATSRAAVPEGLGQDAAPLPVSVRSVENVACVIAAIRGSHGLLAIRPLVGAPSIFELRDALTAAGFKTGDRCTIVWKES